MIILVILFGVLVCGSTYLFFAPFYLEIDTTQNKYWFRFHRFALLSYVAGSDPKLVMKVMVWKKEIYLSKMFRLSDTATEKEKPHHSKKRKISSVQIKQILRSFKIKEFFLDIDTGDMALNGVLFPFFYGLECFAGKNIRINFIGNNVLIIVIQNSIARVSWALISSKKLKINPS